MADVVDELIVSVRADTQAFARDVAAMKANLDGPLEAGAARAGRAIEGALTRAITTGKLGFDDLKRVALAALAEIARAAVLKGIGEIGGAGGGGGGLAGLGGLIAGLVSGAPGRATGGPVSPGRAYRVGERGPELFVPTSSGSIVAAGSGHGPDQRQRTIAITVHVGGQSGDARAMERSGRQVAQAVRRTLLQMEE